MHKGSGQQSLLFYADLRKDENKNLDKKLTVKPIVNEWIAQYDYVHNIDDQFFFQTDLKAPMQKVVTFDINNPQ